MSLPAGKPISMALGVALNAGIRQRAFGVTLAILLVPNSVLVLYFGLTGSSGNSLITGAVLTVTTVAAGLLCFRRDVVLRPVDFLFFALIACVVLSTVFNWPTSNAKEYELLVISFAAYPACRLVSRADVVSSRSAFIWTTGIVATLGSIATAIALWEQWDDEHGKPLVFGFDAAGIYFLGSLSFLVIALVTAGGQTWRRTALFSALIFLPMAVFAASLVRFTFVALAGALCLALILSEAKQRKFVVAVGFVIFVAIVAGLLARYDQARRFADYAIERSPGEVGFEKPPSCYLKVNPKNSIAIRKVLAEDAFFLIPKAGWIGTGLDSFMKFSCIKMTEVHNSILQSAVEFGWLGGSLLLVMVIIAASSIIPLARYDDSARFAVCSLAFVVLLCLAHGRISRDGVLFALLGFVAGLKDTSPARAPARSAVVA